MLQMKCHKYVAFGQIDTKTHDHTGANERKCWTTREKKKTLQLIHKFGRNVTKNKMCDNKQPKTQYTYFQRQLETKKQNEIEQHYVERNPNETSRNNNIRIE